MQALAVLGLLAKVSVIRAALLCPGTNQPADSAICNSNIIDYPLTPMPHVFAGNELIQIGAGTPNPDDFFEAAEISFTITTRTLIRIWDSFSCRDQFQVQLNSIALPPQLPAIIFNFDINVRACGLFVANPLLAFGNKFYAWSEFILDNPSQWQMKVSVRRQAGPINLVGSLVEMFVQTLPFVQPTSCPFS